MEISATSAKATFQKVAQPVVMVGGIYVAARAAMELHKHFTKKELNWTNGLGAGITILVGVSAFSYALAGNEINIIPQGSKQAGA